MDNHLVILAVDQHSWKLRSSLITYAKMLSFGERGYCNILHNFGNQHVTKSQ
jgi:hypothetical protein